MKKSLFIVAMISIATASGFAGTPPKTGTVLSQTCGPRPKEVQEAGPI